MRFIDGFTKPSKEVIKSMRQMGKEAIKAGKQIQNAGKTISSTGSSLTKSITLPITGVAAAAVKTAADFESAMSEVGAISGASAKDMAELTAKAKEMGATTSFSASESAEAMKYMAMAGWKTADMTKGIAGIMNLAAASGESLAATSDIVTDGLTAFGMAAKESGRFADVMAATSSNANTNVSLMGETFKYCASTAGAMGYSIEDISVAIGIMGNAGIEGSMAGTTLKNTIANLAKPTDAQAAVMKQLGISLTDSSGNMKSFAEVMDNLRSSFDGLSETEKAAAATTLAGKQSMAGLLTIVNASAEDFNKLTAAINGSSGSAEQMAAQMLDNLSGQLTLLKSAIEGITITLGNKLMPYAKSAVSWVQKAADYINNLSDAQFDNIVKWAGMAAAIGPVIMVFGKIVTTIGTAQRMFGTITKTIANFGGIMGIITSPAGIVIGILAGIALAAFLIIKNWDKVKACFSGFAHYISPLIQSFKKFKNIGDVFTAFTNVIKKALSRSGVDLNKFSETVNNIKIRISNIISNVKTIAGALFKGIEKNISYFVPVVSVAFNAVQSTFFATVNTVVSLVGSVMTVLEGLTTFLAGAFTGNWRQAWEGIKTVFNGVFSSLPELCKAPLNAVIAIINGAIAGINRLGLTIPDWVPGIGGQAFSINVPTIPMLYKGTDNWKGGMAVIHDRGGEVVDLPKGSRVYPHDKSIEMARKDGAKNGSGIVQITIQKLADKLEVRNDGDIDRIAEALACRLKKVAFNTGRA